MAFRALMVAVLAGVLTGGAAAAAAETCDAPFSVPQQSFKRIEARNAYVWVDQISSSGSRYKPFQIVVVVGSAYPPFKAAEGRLTRASFDSLMKSAYGVTGTNATVSEAALKGGVSVRFTSGKQAFVLRLVSVNPRRGTDGAVTARLCR